MTVHLSPSTVRLDLKCGKGAISAGEKCHKGGAFPREQAIAAGLGVAALTAGALLLNRRSGATRLRSSGSTAPPSSSSSIPAGPPRLPSSPSPYGYLRAGAVRQSKTQRMRENTQAAARGAEQAISRAAQAEITRAGAVANAMAATGEATGMAVKTTLRELRLRTEAARRRFEPGYRRSPAATRKTPAMLPEGGGLPVSRSRTPSQSPSTVEQWGELAFQGPEALRNAMTDPRTGQPRRRRARGFGRPTGDNYIPFYAPVTLQKNR